MSITLPKQLERQVEREFGRYWLLHCPFHADRSPSMLAYKEDGFYICKSCGRMGNVRGLDGAAAPAARAGRSKSRPAGPHLPTNPSGIAGLCERSYDILRQWPDQGLYLKRRGLEAQIEKQHLGWWSGWITIPIRNRYGVIQGVMLRATSAIQRKTGQRFTQPKNQAPMMFVPDWERTLSASYVCVVFGWADALTLDLLGYPVVTTTGGKDEFDLAWTADWRKPHVLIPDDGEHESMGALMRGLNWRGHVLRLKFPEHVKDPAGFMEVGKSGLLQKQLNRYLKGAGLHA